MANLDWANKETREKEIRETIESICTDMGDYYWMSPYAFSHIVESISKMIQDAIEQQREKSLWQI